MPIKFVFEIPCIAVASLFLSVFPVSCIIAFSKVKVLCTSDKKRDGRNGVELCE